MIFRRAQILLLIVCGFHSTLTQVDEVSTQWTYEDNRSNNTNSLPDSIQFDLDLVKSEKITFNLIKQPTSSITQPLMLTQFKGQRSVWNTSENEFLGVYKGHSFDASATVAIKNVGGIEETMYTMTFTHGKKYFSLEPSADFVDRSEETASRKNYINNSRLVIIDGGLHSLVEIQITRSRRDVRLHKDQFNDMTKETRMNKRSAQIPRKKRLMTVEIFTITDYVIFNKYFTQSKAASESDKREDARITIRYFLTHIMEDVRLDFESMKLKSLKFTIKWVGALIAEHPEDVPFIENENSKIDSNTANSTSILEELKKWQIKEKESGNEFKLPNRDVIAVYTGYKMTTPYTIVNGEASGFDACDDPVVSASSIISYRHLLYTSLITSHEVGHNVGIYHDDTKYNECNQEDNFIMAPSAYLKEINFHNSYFFSECSTQNLEQATRAKDYLEQNCFTDSGEDFNKGRDRDIFLHLYPGQIYDLDDQCKLNFGPISFYCGSVENDKKMCKIIHCYTGRKCETIRLLNAMDGTPCSNGAWCRRGKCVKDGRAPKAPERCINGDIKHPFAYNSTTLLCTDAIKQTPDICKDENVKNKCCASCEGKRTSVGDCQDTVGECLNLKQRDCYNGYYATTCCKTCRGLVRNPLDKTCLYGDRNVGCSEWVPEVCHLSSQVCCKSCAAYKSSITTIYTSMPNSSHATSTTHQTMTTDINTISSSSLSRTTLSYKFTTKNSCIHGDFGGVFLYVSVWHNRTYLNCKEIVEFDPNLCHEDPVEKYCCASCSKLQPDRGYCENDAIEATFDYKSKILNCTQLVEQDTSFCKKADVKNLCCQSCRPLAIRVIEI